MKYELTFAGAATVQAYNIPRYRRIHRTKAQAQAEAYKALAKMSEAGLPAAAHSPVIYSVS